MIDLIPVDIRFLADMITGDGIDGMENTNLVNIILMVLLGLDGRKI